MAFPREGYKIPFSQAPHGLLGTQALERYLAKEPLPWVSALREAPYGTDLTQSFPPAPVDEKATSGAGRLGDSSQGAGPGGVFYLPFPKCPAPGTVHHKGP